MRRNRRRYRSGKKSFSVKNFVPLMVLLSVVGFVLWLLWTLITALFSGEPTSNESARLTIYNGRVETQLSGTDVWSPAYSENAFLEGDSLKTGPNTRAALDFFGENTVILDTNTTVTIDELQRSKSGKKRVILGLVSGQAWTKVSDEAFKEDAKSLWQINTDRLSVVVAGTVFNLKSGNSQDSIHLIKGDVEVAVNDLTGNKEAQVINLGKGQKLVVDISTYQQILNNKDVLEIVGDDFIEADWHVNNLEIFFPQEAAEVKRTIELEAKRNQVETAPEAEASNLPEGSLPAPKILSPAAADKIPATNNSVKIEGTAPLEAYQMVVNGYTLSKFNAGDGKWTYFASTKFGTMVSGENTYEVYAVGRDGKKSSTSSLTIFYEGGATETGKTVETVSETPVESGSIKSPDFVAPRVTSPAIFQVSQDEIYQTSASVVTFSGNVDPKTNAVEVNGYRLNQFKPGSTSFKYIANANYNNMKEGENTYVITAFGPDGKQSSTQIKIFYTPLNLGQ